MKFKPLLFEMKYMLTNKIRNSKLGHRLFSNAFFIRAKIGIKNIQAAFAICPGNVQPLLPRLEIIPVIEIIGGKPIIAGMNKREYVHRNRLLHPTIHLNIFSPDRKYMLIQCRSAFTSSSTNKLASTVGSHINGSNMQIGTELTAETIKASLEGEAAEEAGLRMSDLSPVYLKSYNHASDNGNNQEHVSLYTGCAKVGRVAPNSIEVKWLGWFSVKGIIKLAKQSPRLFAPSFIRDLQELGIYN